MKPKRTRSCVLLLTVLAVMATGGAAAEIYKYTDENGIVHYSSERPAGVANVRTFRFPCYASDPTCGRKVDWERVPLVTDLFADAILDAADLYRVDSSLIRAVIHAESDYRPDARSPKGAQGLMQLMPATQAELEVVDPYDPELNIHGGTRYLAQMLDLFDGDVELASAAYNAGPAAVRRYGGIPPYAETKEYVRRIRILHRRYRGAGA